MFNMKTMFIYDNDIFISLNKHQSDLCIVEGKS